LIGIFARYLEMESESSKNSLTVSPDTSKTLNKLLDYSIVQKCYQYATWFCSSAKKTSPMVKYGCDIVESTVCKTHQWIQPKIDPILQSKMYHHVDEYAFHQVEKIEKIAIDVLKWSEERKEAAKKMRIAKHIQTAVSNLDEALQTTNRYLETTRESINVPDMVADAKQTVRKTTADAIVALLTVVEEIGKQSLEIPQQTFHALSEKAEEYSIRLDSAKDANVFASAAASSITKLKELKETVSTQSSSIAKGHLGQAVTSTLHHVLDSLLVLTSPPGKREARRIEAKTET